MIKSFEESVTLRASADESVTLRAEGRTEEKPGESKLVMRLVVIQSKESLLERISYMLMNNRWW